MLVFFFVLGLGHMLLLKSAAGGLGPARFRGVGQFHLCGTDGESRQQLLQILALAGRTCRDGLPDHKQFKFIFALAALVIEDGHRSERNPSR